MESKFNSPEKKAFTREEIANAISKVGGDALFARAQRLDSDDIEGRMRLLAIAEVIGLIGGQVLVELFDKEEEV